MRKFTTLFLLALAMTIGANQAFAQNAAGSNDNGRSERSSNDDDDDRGNDGDSGFTRVLPILITHVPPNRRIWPVVEKKTEDCSCQQKVMRVGARFVTVRDCYQSIQVKGRERLRYCSMR